MKAKRMCIAVICIVALVGSIVGYKNIPRGDVNSLRLDDTQSIKEVQVPSNKEVKEVIGTMAKYINAVNTKNLLDVRSSVAVDNNTSDVQLLAMIDGNPIKSMAYISVLTKIKNEYSGVYVERREVKGKERAYFAVHYHVARIDKELRLVNIHDLPETEAQCKSLVKTMNVPEDNKSILQSYGYEDKLLTVKK